MQTTDFVYDLWYFAVGSKEVLQGKMLSKVLLGEPILFYRDSKNQVAAVRDICPHRGIPLSYGQIIDDQVECPYHGWRFNQAGQCTLIPSLTSNQDLDCRKIKVKSFLVQEFQGMVWIYMPAKNPQPADSIPVPPIMKEFSKHKQPNVFEKTIFKCHVDHAVIGLMDPAHGPFIHKSWAWRSAKTIYEKRKKFAPVKFGFQMVRHQPSSNSKAYKILGGAPTTEITFSLPGVRVEHVQIGRRNFFSYTLLTPIDAKNTQIYQLAFWDSPWLSLIKPFVVQFTRLFLGQDRKAVEQQQEGLKYNPSLMLIHDADTQAKWYYSLKKEWAEHLHENREFKNPVVATELQWRS
ncbi:MAG: Rieske 2Fe-2S domain-containing protein [Pseudobdellovibrionaceae bacterium]